ncbi:MAG: hypothetical protein AB8B56_08355 [Crocinitomicaceae bacterium]
MKNIFNSGNKITKKEQKSIIGGGAPLGVACYGRYIADDGSNKCAVPAPSGSGAVLFGTIQNGQCCVDTTFG